MEPIYLDNAATTPLREEVRAALLESLAEFGNPSSVHGRGRRARDVLEESRERIAGLIGASRGEVIFTPGGTAADNLAILGRWRAWRKSNGGEGAVAISAIEHSAVLSPATAAGREGASVIVLGVTREGVVDIGAIDEAIGARPAVVSVIWANNEVGTIQPIEELAARCAEAGVVFHSDAVQAFGRIPVRVDDVPVSLVSLSAHKIGGPTGIGALFVRKGVEVEPLIHGGGQESGLWPGTESVAAAVGFALAAELADRERETEARRLGELRDRLQVGLLERIPGAEVNGGGAPRLPNILNISIPGVDREVLLFSLDLEGIAASSGSACQSGAAEPSRVLVAMGRDGEADTPLRLSLGHDTTEAEIESAIERIARVVERVRALAGA